MQNRVIDKPTNIKNSDARKAYLTISMKRPTFTVRLTVEVDFLCSPSFSWGLNFLETKMAKSVLSKILLKNSKFRFLSKSRHLPFVLKGLETRIKTMKIFLTGKLKWKRPTFTVRLTFSFKRSTFGNIFRILQEVSRHLPFVYLSWTKIRLNLISI